MREAVIFGAGNIGRGFIGQLFCESGYHITFVDIDRPLLDTLNARQQYTIRLASNERVDEVTIGPLRALHAAEDRSGVAEALTQAEFGATAVGARVLPRIAPLVAKGVSRRAELGVTTPLNLILCENLKGAAAAFRQMVDEHLSPAEQVYAHHHLGLVDTVIGRMVPPPTPEMRAADPGLIVVEPYKELPVDRRGFIGEIPPIVCMEACDNFAAYTARKLYIHNCGHACLAYLGHLSGHEFGYQALEDAQVYATLKQALDESKTGVVAEYNVQPGWLDTHIADLLRRFANRALGDTIFRLCRDPLRKLAANDRLVGAARLAEKAGCEPKALCRSIAAAYRFDAADDPVAVSMQQRLAVEGLAALLAEVSGIHADEPLGRIIMEQYETIKESANPR